MEKTEIKKRVELELEKWTSLQENRQVNVSFTPKAVDFLCLMIENIREDKSQYWDKNELETENAQELAISLIPNALNDLTYFKRYRRPVFRGKRDFKISTWEIWHSLSDIVDRFCFIPKDI